MALPPLSQHRDMSRSHRGLAAAVLPLGGGLAMGLMVYACVRVGTPAMLTILFALWVGTPFAALAVATSMSSVWTPPARRTLDLMALLIAVGSGLLYGIVALGPGRPKAPVFVMVPPASMLLVILVVGGVAVRNRRR